MMHLKPLSRLLGVAATAATFIAGAAFAQNAGSTLHISTGSGAGTYSTFARNIAQVLPAGMNLEIHESDGSVENLRRLLGYLGSSSEYEGSCLASLSTHLKAFWAMRLKGTGETILLDVCWKMSVSCRTCSSRCVLSVPSFF